jgi:two-component system, sensor histidine kinase LadS
MIHKRHVVSNLLRLLSVLIFIFPVCAMAIDVTMGGKIKADSELAWCATDRHVSHAAILAGACLLQWARPGDLTRVSDQRAFWLRIKVENRGPIPIERWVSIGHPRLEEISLFTHDRLHGWQRSNSGIRTPLAQRNSVARTYGALPIILAPFSEQTVWLRVASRTSIDLSTTLWAPEAFQEISARELFSLALALGALLIVMTLSGLAFLTSREWAYLFFAVAMLGEILVESFRSGLLQRYFLPPNMAMPVETVAFGSLLALVGFSTFFLLIIPDARRRGWLSRTYIALLGICLAGQLWSLLIDYKQGAAVWQLAINGALLNGITLAVLAWREGKRPAGILVFSFAFLCVLEILRMGSTIGWIPFIWNETMIGPWALVMTTPLFLMSIFLHSKRLSRELMRAELENSAKVALLAQMSHELRSPLDTILGSAQLLSHPNGSQLAPDGLSNIQQSGKHLLKMIDEILDHARGVAGKLTLVREAVDWQEFMSLFEQKARLLATRSHSLFMWEHHGERVNILLIDEQRLLQILDNLLSNAIRHTQDGTIILMSSAHRLTATQIRLAFQVIDTGEGIALEEQKRIFLPFERGSNNSKRARKGTGMGLAITRQLVEAMGGTLSVKSEIGQGACFSFKMNCDIADKAADTGNNRNIIGYEGRRRTVLVVDDDLSSLNILSSLLGSCGFGYHVAESGKNAIDAIHQLDSIDLVLVDQLMPDGDAWDVLREISGIGLMVPVVLVSSTLPMRPADFKGNADFSAFLLKPLDHSTLLRTLGKLLNLNCVYGSITPAIKTTAISEDRPDKESLLSLEQMIADGRLTDIMDWASILKNTQPHYSRFASKVYAAAGNIDFPTLLLLAQSTE